MFQHVSSSVASGSPENYNLWHDFVTLNYKYSFPDNIYVTENCSEQNKEAGV